jgi:hypothetical protein
MSRTPGSNTSLVLVWPLNHTVTGMPRGSHRAAFMITWIYFLLHDQLKQHLPLNASVTISEGLCHLHSPATPSWLLGSPYLL